MTVSKHQPTESTHTLSGQKAIVHIVDREWVIGEEMKCKCILWTDNRGATFKHKTNPGCPLRTEANGPNSTSVTL